MTRPRLSADRDQAGVDYIGDRHHDVHQQAGPGLNLRQIEDRVDQVQQMPPRRQDIVGIIRDRRATLVLRHLFLDQLREPNDGMQRRAEFMAHIRQELGLGPVRGLRPLGAGEQFPVRHLQMAAIHQDLGVGCFQPAMLASEVDLPQGAAPHFPHQQDRQQSHQSAGGGAHDQDQQAVAPRPLQHVIHVQTDTDDQRVGRQPAQGEQPIDLVHDAKAGIGIEASGFHVRAPGAADHRCANAEQTVGRIGAEAGADDPVAAQQGQNPSFAQVDRPVQPGQFTGRQMVDQDAQEGPVVRLYPPRHRDRNRLVWQFVRGFADEKPGDGGVAMDFERLVVSELDRSQIGLHCGE